MLVLSCFSSKREPFQPLHKVSACRAAAISGGPLSRQPQQRLSPRTPWVALIPVAGPLVALGQL